MQNGTLYEIAKEQKSPIGLRVTAMLGHKTWGKACIRDNLQPMALLRC